MHIANKLRYFMVLLPILTSSYFCMEQNDHAPAIHISGDLRVLSNFIKTITIERNLKWVTDIIAQIPQDLKFQCDTVLYDGENSQQNILDHIKELDLVITRLVLTEIPLVKAERYRLCVSIDVINSLLHLGGVIDHKIEQYLKLGSISLAYNNKNCLGLCILADIVADLGWLGKVHIPLKIILQIHTKEGQIEYDIDVSLHSHWLGLQNIVGPLSSFIIGVIMKAMGIDFSQPYSTPFKSINVGGFDGLICVSGS